MIEEQRFRFKGADDRDIAGYRWVDSKATPRKILIVAHGAAEHALRYREPLEPIIAADYAVYGEDHRGHGLTARNADELGAFGPGGAPAVNADLAALTKRAQAEFPGLPTIFMGHSMGSMLGQVFVLDHHDLLDGFVLSGTLDMATSAANPRPRGNAGVGGEQTRERFAWLSRDVAQVDKYIADPLCGFALTKETRETLGTLRERASNAAELAKLPANLPIYIFVGDQDPINNELAFFHPLVDRYKAAGVKSVTPRIYKDGRHEMLNETNRDEVVADLLRWMEQVPKRSR